MKECVQKTVICFLVSMLAMYFMYCVLGLSLAATLIIYLLGMISLNRMLDRMCDMPDWDH